MSCERVSWFKNLSNRALNLKHRSVFYHHYEIQMGWRYPKSGIRATELELKGLEPKSHKTAVTSVFIQILIKYIFSIY